jgi:hypothetical protein
MDCAVLLSALSSRDDLHALPRGILANGVPDWLPDIVSYFERWVDTIKSDREQAHRWEILERSNQVDMFSMQRLFVEDVGELIELGVVPDGQVSVVFPSLAEGATGRGTVVRWFKVVGERIDRDEVLLTISTEGVDVEIQSPAAGHLSGVWFDKGESVGVNEIVATIDAD